MLIPIRVGNRAEAILPTRMRNSMRGYPPYGEFVLAAVCSSIPR